MTVPAYPTYHDSGNAALGMVPTGWPLTRLRFVADFNPSKQETASLPPDTEVSFLPMEAIGDDGSLRLDATRPLSTVEQGYTYFRDGDVVIAKITPCFENGKGALVNGLVGGVGFGTTELIVVRPKERQTLGPFLQWVFVSPDFRNTATASMYGAGGQKRVPDVFVRDFLVALPHIAEQSAIAAFLDRETGKIDALVAEQERLIALLKEKRQAVISQAVTKGLDASAPMKESGVAWLGQVPAHWEVKRLKNIAEISYGLGQPPEYHEDGTRFLRATNVKRGSLSDEGLVFVNEADLPSSRITRLACGDIVVVRSGAYTGDSALVTLDWNGAIAGFDMVVKVDREKADPEFAAAALLSKYMLDGQINLLRQRAAQPHLNAEELGELTFLQPSLEEQQAIAVGLRDKTAQLNTLTTEAHRAIALLRERRAALISAAVTGKIDVRGLAAAAEKGIAA